MMRLRLSFYSLCLCAHVVHAANWYVAPGATGIGTLASPGSLTNAVAGTGWASAINNAGDSVWLRGGTYEDGTNMLTFTYPGITNNPVTWRNYTNEVATINQRLRFGGNGYHRFWGLEFYDSEKATLLVSPAGRTGLFTDDSGSLGNEWINCYFHDTGIVWGNSSGRAIRGCVIIFAGQAIADHVIYPGSLGLDFSGNIVGWATDTIQIGAPNMTIRSNILFGMGETMTDTSRELLLSDANNAIVDYNCFYERKLDGTAIYCNSPNQRVSRNIIAAHLPISFDASITSAISTNNVVHRNGANDAFYVLHRGTALGDWTINDNAYSALATVRFNDTNNSKTFPQWREAYPAFDSTSTSTNASVPADVVRVYPNADEAKRAHVAVYNWTSNDNVSVNLSGVLSVGDSYQLWSAQNYTGAIRTATFTGSTISVPMTNLTAATILYGTNNAVVVQPTSPQFAAFVVIGSVGAADTGGVDISNNATIGGNVTIQ